MSTKTKDSSLEKNPDLVRVLMIGDVVGKAGRDVLVKNLPEIRESRQIDFVIVNAENAAGGSGLTPDIYVAILAAGTDCVTLGDHAFRQKSILPILNSDDKRVVRPMNLPPEAPGRGWTVLDVPASGTRPAAKIGVLALLGRVFMQTQSDNPLLAADKALERFSGVKIRFLDFHAEATSEKQIMGRYLDGRFSAVLGTHTHVATADEQIFPGGTAFQCDVGMTGAFDSIIGRKIEPVVEHFRTAKPATFDCASGSPAINGAIVDVDPANGKARQIRRLVYPV
ncbi:MAG: YmdB family metallophosphoesterase [Thermoguttaceae bacterium]|nr:YmdB family metallophosphoesterase [Thermoguttaceae bacterium]